eukprot:2569360-Rhodomonas_salina.2
MDEGDTMAAHVIELLREILLSNLRAILPQMRDAVAQRLGAGAFEQAQDVCGTGALEQVQDVCGPYQGLLRRLPTLILEQTWPEEQIALGLQAPYGAPGAVVAFRNGRDWNAGKQVAEEWTEVQPPRTVLLQGAQHPWEVEPYHIFMSFRQFRSSAIQLRWRNVALRQSRQDPRYPTLNIILGCMRTGRQWSAGCNYVLTFTAISTSWTSVGMNWWGNHVSRAPQFTVED